MAVMVGSLFSGAGGIDLAFERAGCHIAWQCEIDPTARAVLARHWPDVERYTDVRDLRGADVAPVDLLCGGFPCTDISVAGRRAGLAGEQSGLWWEFHRLIAELRPRWVVIENVPGLRSSWSAVEPPPFTIPTEDFDSRDDAERWASNLDGEWDVDETSDLDTLLASLGELGYWWAYRSLDAQYAGLAQRRERVFIVGHLGDRAAPATVLFEPESVCRDTPPRREARQDVAHSARASTGSRGTDDPDRVTFIAGTVSAKWARGTGGPSGDETQNLIPAIVHTLRAEGHDASEDGTGCGTPIIPFDTTQITSTGNYSQPRAGDPCHPLASSAHPPAIAFSNRGYDGASAERLRAGSHGATPMIADALMVRRLTPLECERLQGLPDNWTRYRADGSEISDSRRYRLVGNGVAVPVVAWIARRIVAYEREEITA